MPSNQGVLPSGEPVGRAYAPRLSLTSRSARLKRWRNGQLGHSDRAERDGNPPEAIS